MQSRINHPQRAKQLIDFAGLSIDGYIYPTDIDGLIEYKDSEYILFEVKHGVRKSRLGRSLRSKEWWMTSPRLVNLPWFLSASIPYTTLKSQ